MTSNMIAFRKYEEDVRHNREMERLTGEQQAEVVRHNTATEEETYRTNAANERIKTQQNVINDNHYQRSDFETARSHGITELYTLQYPYSYGQTSANVQKTLSEVGLNKAKTGEATASATEKYAKAELEGSQTNLNKVKTRSESKNLTLLDLQADKLRAETELTKTKTQYYPSESISNTINKGAGALNSVLQGITSIIKSAKPTVIRR